MPIVDHTSSGTTSDKRGGGQLLIDLSFWVPHSPLPYPMFLRSFHHGAPVYRRFGFSPACLPLHASLITHHSSLLPFKVITFQEAKSEGESRQYPRCISTMTIDYHHQHSDTARSAGIVDGTPLVMRENAMAAWTLVSPHLKHRRLETFPRGSTGH
ncbi:hypothetical protein BS17DRAFT_778357 [Gyrodon lividus]|nr:hypothetical protein BS17DRAFT_778357 [Gyrodon lividus]